LFVAPLLVLAATGVANAQSAVTMTAVEFAFQPSTVTVGPGSVTFTLRNTGQFPHNIHIDGVSNDLFADNLTSGQAGTATVTLAPGTYAFWCPVDGHRDRGMEGTLIVAGAQAGRAGGLDPLAASGALAALGTIVLGAGLVRKRAGA
jgi:plastocyanin